MTRKDSSYEELCLRAKARRHWRIDRVVHDRSQTVVVGESGIGKTALAVSIGISVAAGQPFMGRSTAQGRVLYVDAESNPRDMASMVRGISRLIGLDAPPDDFTVWQPDFEEGDPDDRNIKDRLEEQIREAQPRVVIIDPLRAFFPEAEKTETSPRVIAELPDQLQRFALVCYVDHTPFKRNGVTVVKLSSWAETPRHRRLEPDEEDRLLAAANPRLRNLVIAALETGCRLGELLSMQWHQVRWSQNVIYLPSERTKTAEPRVVPISGRLRRVLEMRQHDTAGDPLGPDAFVFGNEVGERVRSIKTAWANCRRRAGVTGLHFHDLRREFGSRVRESGASDHDVRDWLGHTNITTTSRYLATTQTRLQHVLEGFERFRQSTQAGA